METHKISFIGAGNMANALIAGLIADGFTANNIWVSDPSDKNLTAMEEQFGIQTSSDNKVAIARADIVVLSIKPQIMRAVCEEICAVVNTHKPLIISIAAGIQIKNLAACLGEKIALVRAMPNTPALIKTGATGLFANEYVSEDQQSIAEEIMRAVGVALWVDEEKQMDYVTALSGSGPAYFFRIMEAMEKSACELGLPIKTAHLLTLQTALGAAKLAMESQDSMATLREKVTSPGGTTERGLAAMEASNIDEVIEKTLAAASLRAAELATEYGEK
ncbi:MAG: pyrroline-5-carboxylate reductase [Robiginitomaculum sp.]|nr:pyrroline-5-carboxylate reductase [Robiginitomaculum sp.]